MKKYFDPVILSQHVDTLKTSHKSINESDFNGKFQKFCSILDDLKEEAQNIKGFSNSERFVVAELLGLGRFRVHAQGNQAYKYIVSNDDVYIKIGNIAFGSDRPQITIEYRQSFLFTVGHKKAYEIGLTFVKKALGDTFNNVSEIHLATDVWGCGYDRLDLERFQSNFKMNEISDNDLFMFRSTSRRTLETISFGKSSFMFRIYDKIKQIAHYPEKRALLIPKWVLNGYDENSKAPVFRHEIQLRDEHLKKHIPTDCSDRVGHVFANLAGLWAYAVDKVEYVDLTKEEVLRCMDGASPDTQRQIFYRAKTDKSRSHFWDCLRYWDNRLVSQTLTYRHYKQSRAKIGEAAAKRFVTSVYKTMGDNPENLVLALDSVNSEIVKFKGLTLHQYAQMKIVDSFVQNENLIRKLGIAVPDVHDHNFLTAQKAYFDVISKIPASVVSSVRNRSFERIVNERLEAEARELF